MFLRCKIRRKDGKEHRAWSVVENRRVHDRRVVQRQVLYLGEINDSQRSQWSKAIEVFDESAGQSKQIALFPEDRRAPALACDVVSIRLSAMRLRRPRKLHNWAFLDMIAPLLGACHPLVFRTELTKSLDLKVFTAKTF